MAATSREGTRDTGGRGGFLKELGGRFQPIRVASKYLYSVFSEIVEERMVSVVVSWSCEAGLLRPVLELALAHGWGLVLRPQGEGLLLQLGPRILLPTAVGEATVMAERAGAAGGRSAAPALAGGAVHWCSSSGALH